MATEALTKIAPLLAVREALGLSVEDAAKVLEQPNETIEHLDTLPVDSLAILAELFAKDGGTVILAIKNPDDTTFKEWKVTEDGFLTEKSNG